MADMSNALLRNLYILEDENNPYSSRSSTVYPSTTLDSVFDQLTPDDKTLRTILDELHQDIISSGVGNIVFPVTSVNGMQGNVKITKAELGLENVDNTADMDKPLSIPQTESIMAILKDYDFNPDLSDLYEHMQDSFNPHGVTLEQLDMDNSVTEFVQAYIQEHDYSKDCHVELRNKVEEAKRLTGKLDKKVDEQVAGLIKLLEGHMYDGNAHTSLFDKKLDKSNRVITFDKIDNLNVPTTKAVSDYVDSKLAEFNSSTVENVKRVIDIGVVNSRNDLPNPDINSYMHGYFIINGDGINDEFAVCRDNGLDYEWDITKMGSVSKFNPKQFIDQPDGLSFNIDLITSEVLKSDQILKNFSDLINDALSVGMGRYLTRDEYTAQNYLTDIKITSGTQSGSLRYTVTGTGETRSDDIFITDLNKLAFLDKVTKEYIEENAVEYHHLANRAVGHRNLQDQSVAAHNLRAKYMHIFGNIEDQEGLTVSEIPIEVLINLVTEQFDSWVESGSLMDWFRAAIEDLVRKTVHDYDTWNEPMTWIKVYINSDGQLVESGDEDMHMPYMYIDKLGQLIMLDDDDMLMFRLMERCRYYINNDGYLVLVQEIWPEPMSTIRVYMNDDGYMVEESDLDTAPYIYINKDGEMIMYDEERLIGFQDMKDAYYFIDNDGYLREQYTSIYDGSLYYGDMM